jgi:hypothetical protein
MLSTLLLAGVVIAAVAALCGAMYVMAVQLTPVLAPVGPFAPGTADPSADTMAGQAEVNTVFSDDGWKSITLSRLCDVEDLLDQLEAHHVTEREMLTLGNASFCVRWK